MTSERQKPDGILLKNNMDINLILLAPEAMIVGWQYYKPEEDFNFTEVNLFLFFFQVQLRYGKNL